jgi:hypothetical protein
MAISFLRSTMRIGGLTENYSIFVLLIKDAIAPVFLCRLPGGLKWIK